jgi:hypothetical protein
MSTELATTSNHQRALTTRSSSFTLPAIIADQGEKAAERFFTFFTDQIPNAKAGDGGQALQVGALGSVRWEHPLAEGLDRRIGRAGSRQ